MTKEDFLQKLRRELQGLSEADIEEILADQKEFIYDAVSAGRSEEEVLSSLGSPKAFADALKLEYKVKKIKEASSLWEKYKEVLGSLGLLLALMPLNFLLLSGPVLVVLSFMFTWVSVCSVCFLFSLLMLPLSLGSAFVLGFWNPLFLTALFSSMASVFFFLAALILFYEVSRVLVFWFIKYINWNVKLVKEVKI